MPDSNWLVWTCQLHAIDVDRVAAFLVATIADAPTFQARSWVLRKAGRGDATSGLGAPTIVDLAVPELHNGAMIMARRGFLSLLSAARARRTVRGWGEMYGLQEGFGVQLNLKALTPAELAEARRYCAGLTGVAVESLQGSAPALEWRLDGVTTTEVVPGANL